MKNPFGFLLLFALLIGTGVGYATNAPPNNQTAIVTVDHFMPDFSATVYAATVDAVENVFIQESVTAEKANCLAVVVLCAPAPESCGYKPPSINYCTKSYSANEVNYFKPPSNAVTEPDSKENSLDWRICAGRLPDKYPLFTDWCSDQFTVVLKC